jgi:hypothetical protein
MMKALTFAILFWTAIGCERQSIPAAQGNPPRRVAQSSSKTVALVGPQLEPTLKAVRTPKCPHDNISAETVAFLKQEVRFEFAVSVVSSGSVQQVTLLRVTPPNFSNSRLAEYAQKCLVTAVFSKPPHVPYRMSVAVQFPGRSPVDWPVEKQ